MNRPVRQKSANLHTITQILQLRVVEKPLWKRHLRIPGLPWHEVLRRTTKLTMSDLDLTLRLCVEGTNDEEGRKQEALANKFIQE